MRSSLPPLEARTLLRSLVQNMSHRKLTRCADKTRVVLDYSLTWNGGNPYLQVRSSLD